VRRTPGKFVATPSIKAIKKPRHSVAVLFLFS